jgi:hypothetical protein
MMVILCGIIRPAVFWRFWFSNKTERYNQKTKDLQTMNNNNTNSNKARKRAHADNPFRTNTQREDDKKVYLGAAGNTPRVIIDSTQSGDLSPANRPKTSRGKSHPSPDEFFDYVIPSPGSNNANRKPNKVVEVIMVNDNKKLGIANSERKTGNLDLLTILVDEKREHASASQQEITEEYLLGLQFGNGSKVNNKKVTLVGCWLLGSALRI